jgi:hypothetical protein
MKKAGQKTRPFLLNDVIKSIVENITNTDLHLIHITQGFRLDKGIRQQNSLSVDYLRSQTVDRLSGSSTATIVQRL